jgi:hypothetical protein
MLIQLYIEYIRIYTSRYDAAESHVQFRDIHSNDKVHVIRVKD